MEESKVPNEIPTHSDEEKVMIFAFLITRPWRPL
jgi:hypothetical protein